MRPDGRPSGPGRPDQARVFFALWPDARVRGALHAAAVAGARRCGGRAMAAPTLHLTLAFIGDVPLDRLSALHAAAGEVQGEPFALHLDRLGYWRHNHILWAGSSQDAPALSRLAGSLAARLEAAGWPSGIKPGRPFAPHITLVRKVAEEPPQVPALPAVDWSCGSFVLVRSRLSSAGSAYEIIGEWPLG